MDNSEYKVEFVVDKVSKPGILYNFFDGGGLFVVEDDDVGTGGVLFFDLFKFDSFSIDLDETLLTDE